MWGYKEENGRKERETDKGDGKFKDIMKDIACHLLPWMNNKSVPLHVYYMFLNTIMLKK